MTCAGHHAPDWQTQATRRHFGRSDIGLVELHRWAVPDHRQIDNRVPFTFGCEANGFVHPAWHHIIRMPDVDRKTRLTRDCVPRIGHHMHLTHCAHTVRAVGQGDVPNLLKQPRCGHWSIAASHHRSGAGMRIADPSQSHHTSAAHARPRQCRIFFLRAQGPGLVRDATSRKLSIICAPQAASPAQPTRSNSSPQCMAVHILPAQRKPYIEQTDIYTETGHRRCRRYALLICPVDDFDRGICPDPVDPLRCAPPPIRSIRRRHHRNFHHGAGYQGDCRSRSAEHPGRDLTGGQTCCPTRSEVTVQPTSAHQWVKRSAHRLVAICQRQSTVPTTRQRVDVRHFHGALP